MTAGGTGFPAVEPNPHEFTVNLNFERDGLDPFFALDRAVKEAGGSKRGTFETDGERWEVTLYYQDSGIVAPSGRLPSGTVFELDEVREFRLAVNRAGDEDPVGKQRFNAHVRPRWPGMETEAADGTRSKHDYPADELGEAVNVKISGANIDFDRYLTLLQDAASAVGVRWSYFRDPHPTSNIQDASLEVRVDDDSSGPVHARDGPIAEMGHLLENDREGYRKIVQNDTDHHGNTRPGEYHTVTLGPRRVREAFPSHELPVEVKHYYAQESHNFPDDHPLAHPKVGVSYQANRRDGTLYHHDLQQLEHELKRVLYSVLADAGFDLAPTHGTGPYVPDAYFDADVKPQPVEPVELDLTRVRQEQESIVIRQIADGLSPVQWESLQTLVADGGEISPTDIADEHDRHPDSVRRALRELEGMVERRYGEVALASEYIAELVVDQVREARERAEQSVRDATETAAKALHAADRGLEGSMASFMAWAARHGIDVDAANPARDARLKLRFGEYPGAREAARAVKTGFDVWRDAGLPEHAFREATVRFADGSASTAWRYLKR